MDNNFFKILKGMETKTTLSQDEINVIANMDNIQDMIMVAYKAGYRDCKGKEMHRTEMDCVLSELEQANAQLLLMQTAIPELVDGQNGEVLELAFLGLHDNYKNISSRLAEII